ncbi:MAG: FlgD immunoglobulin-like domain containing protein, partial [Candidatus Krumholzibacteriota bacterium]
ALTAPGAGDPPIRVRFAFRSDGAWSDEDGHNPTDGAFRLDNVRVIDVDGVTILDESTFDTGLDGWMPGKPASPGEYVLQPYEHWSDYGPRPDGEGYAWTAIEQPNGVFPAHVAGEPYWNVGIESPRIEIPADADAYLISFDVYRQLPLFEGLFYYWAVAVPAPEDGGVWRSFNTVYYGDRQAWFSHGEDISILTTPGATSMRLRLQARYFPQFFWPRPSGVFTGPGPIFGGVTVLAQTGVQVGSLDVRVFEDEASGCPSPGGGLYGVTANVFDATGAEVGTFVTDIDGFFNVPELDAGDYQVSVVRPLGYSAAADELAVTVVGGETALAEFPLDCAASTGAMRGMGYWKHQVNEALGGGGLGRGRRLKIDDPLPPDIDSPICDLLDLIVVHFNDNAVNEVRVYDPAEGATCTDKLDRALSLLNLPGSQEMVERARQHFMVLLLNTASGYINPTDVVSDDGATLSQAITYCDNLIDDQAGDHESAMGIAEMINNGDMVPAGMIPLDTVQIAYRHKVPAGQFLLGNKPNPFNPSTTISFVLPETGSTTLKIYDVSGHLVRTLLNGTAESQGLREVVWNGKNEAGRVVAAGVYFCKLDAGGYSEVRRMTLVK